MAAKRTTKKKTGKAAAAPVADDDSVDPIATSPRVKRGEPDGTVGRPPYVWDEQALVSLQVLAKARNDVQTMALILGVAKRTLESVISWDDNTDPEDQHPCALAYHTGVANMCNTLRVEQFTTAKGGGRGAPTMLIWLGKQHLGQRDVRPIELTGKDGKPLELDLEYMPAVERQLLSFLRNRAPKTFSRTPEGSNGSGSKGSGSNGSGE